MYILIFVWVIPIAEKWVEKNFAVSFNAAEVLKSDAYRVISKRFILGWKPLWNKRKHYNNYIYESILVEAFKIGYLYSIYVRHLSNFYGFNSVNCYVWILGHQIDWRWLRDECAKVVWPWKFIWMNWWNFQCGIFWNYKRNKNNQLKLNSIIKWTPNNFWNCEPYHYHDESDKWIYFRHMLHRLYSIDIFEHLML